MVLIQNNGSLLISLIDLNDFKYRGAQKVINSFKEFELKNQNNINDIPQNNEMDNNENIKELTQLSIRKQSD